MFLDLKISVNLAQFFFGGRSRGEMSGPSEQGGESFVWSDSQVTVAGAGEEAGTLSESGVGWL